MPYGTIKVDNIVFTNAGVDQTIGVSGLVQSISGNLTVTGTISGNIIRGNTVSGATITGGVLNAVSGVFAPGTSGTPSISFTSDSNTGFWSPAGDTVAISTGGSERIRVDSDGDLGIGTTSPTSRLTVRADAATGPNTIIRVENRSVSAGATTQNIRIEGILDYNNGTSDASAGAIVFGKDGTYTTSTANIDSYLALETVLNNTSTERFRITSSGRVGIGTTSPSTTLDVSGTLNVTGAATLAGGGTSTTSAVDTNSTAIATTAFVVGQAGAATPLINGTATVGTSLRYSRQDHIHPTDTTRAALASPTFTGTPAAPTAALGTNTTQIATTAYVKTEISNSTAANVSGTVAIANGGTGQTTAANAINALVPSQTSNSGKVLGTNGSVVSWVAGNAGDAQTFNSSGTWTKPTSGTFALIRCWGGGGSGAREDSSGGGGGGGCMERLMLLSDLASTVTVTIGAGGTAISGSDANGNAGGNTTFGSHVTGTGGQGGTTAGIGGTGGGGLGTLFAGATSSALSGSSSGAYGGGSGGTDFDTGGDSSYGGAGGGGRSNNTVRAGGTSEYGGAGGAGGGAGAGAAGSVPGGGGGASSTTSGAGAAGRCIVYVF